MTVNPFEPPVTHDIDGRPGAQPTGIYEPQRGRVTLLTVMLGGMVVLSIAGAISTYMEMDLLERASAGLVDEAEANANDSRQVLLGSLTVIVYLSTAVVFSMFLHRANKNARALSPETMFSFTPGWTVGWFFVPIASLWKPYQAVRELWEKSRPVLPGIMGAWWGFWITDNVLNQIAYRMADENATITELHNVDKVMMAADVVGVVSAVLAIAVVRSIHASQQEHHETGKPQMLM
ncbi:MAG: DUF4328 domain-containing protein [Deltaproteobacteria bacterium]|nr:DUF4328 domain-containing protein [Deltaproteobacteria bacterium]